jgi:hypothetical protein
MNTAARRPIAFLALLACSLVAGVHASEQDAARHRIGVPKLEGRADIRTEEVESPALPRAQRGLKETQALMSRIRGITDPAERQKLMEQHLQALHDSLAEIRTLMSGDLTRRQLSQRVDLMQALLDQMSERQKVEAGATK